MTIARIVMPNRILTEAVKLAGKPNRSGGYGWTATEHPAVKCITDWWNAEAPVEVQKAYGLAMYVQYEDGWLSGDPEEGMVSHDQWHAHIRINAEASLCDGRVVFIFLTQSEDENDHSFFSKAVDGSHGYSGGKWPEISGDALITFYSYKQLSLIPSRFPDIWRVIST